MAHKFTCLRNFFELWHQAYALGAQIVFWPSAMQTPDRDMISLARLFRFHVVANGYPGSIVNTMGRQVDDFKALPGGGAWCTNTANKLIHDCGVRTGTLDLDATWVHENGPGTLNCPAVAAMCKAHPGVFELSIPGCGHFNRPKACAAGCTCGEVWPGETVKADNSVFLVRSKQPETFPVRTAFRRYGVVPYHDFIKGSRQGINALRQARADIPRPPGGSVPAPMPPCPTITHENVCVLPLCEWQSGKCVAAPKRSNPRIKADDDALACPAEWLAACPGEPCKPLTTPYPAKEVISFHADEPRDSYKFYNWSLITTVITDRHQTELSCMAHKHGVRVVYFAFSDYSEGHVALLHNDTYRKAFVRNGVNETATRYPWLDGKTAMPSRFAAPAVSLTWEGSQSLQASTSTWSTSRGTSPRTTRRR